MNRVVVAIVVLYGAGGLHCAGVTHKDVLRSAVGRIGSTDNLDYFVAIIGVSRQQDAVLIILAGL